MSEENTIVVERPQTFDELRALKELLDFENLPPLLDVGTVARLLDCSVRHVWRLHDRGTIPTAVSLGALRRWNRDEIAQWIAGGCKPCRKGGK